MKQRVSRIVCFMMLGVIALATASCAGQSNTGKAESLVRALVKGDYATASKDFDANMKAAMTPARFEQVRSLLAQQVGAFKSITGSRTASEQGYETVYVACQFERAVIDMKVVFNDKGQVGGLWTVPHK